MSARSQRALAPLLVAVTLGIVAIWLPAPADAYVSAAPFKLSGDSGVVSAYDIEKGNFVGISACVAGRSGTCTYWNPHACVWTDPADNFSNSYQQWNVPYCSLVDSGWISANGLNADPSQAAVYCPSDAPNNWSVYGEGNISAIQQWATDNGGYNESVTYLTPAIGNSFSNPGKASYYVWLGAKSAFTGTEQFWRFFVGCSGAGDTGDGHGGGKYCCGQGVANPGRSQLSAVFPENRARSLRDLHRASRRPFNPRRVHRIDRRLTEVTYEFYPRAHSRRTRRFTCPGGGLRADASHNVSFLTAAPPTRKHARDVRTRAREVGRRSYAVTATTKKIKKHEVRIQVSLMCRH